MSKAEKFIKENTKDCSNKSLSTGKYYFWLTPDQALRAVEIAREEMLNEICEWIGKQKDLLEDSFSDPNDFADILKQAMKDETKWDEFCKTIYGTDLKK